MTDDDRENIQRQMRGAVMPLREVVDRTIDATLVVMAERDALAAPQPAPRAEPTSFTTAQGGQFDGQPAPTDQGVQGTLTSRDRRDERDQGDGGADRRARGEAASAGGARSAMDQHRRDRHAEGADGAHAGGGAADVLLTQPALPPEVVQAMRMALDALEKAKECLWPATSAFRHTAAAINALRTVLGEGR